jgi:hypothetical protein
MKLHKLALAGAVCLLLVLPALAADVTGKWTADVPGRGGQTRETTFTLKSAGDQLTGTMTGPGGDIPIEDGKISGDDLSFSATLSFGGNSIKFLYKGKVQGNEIKFTREREGSGQTQEFTAKRSAT